MGSSDAVLFGLGVRGMLGMFAVAIVSGAASLLMRLSADQAAKARKALGETFRDADIIRTSLPLYATTHVVGSVLAGMLSYLSLSSSISGNTLFSAVGVAAFSGARALNWYSERTFGSPKE